MLRYNPLGGSYLVQRSTNKILGRSLVCKKQGHLVNSSSYPSPFKRRELKKILFLSFCYESSFFRQVALLYIISPLFLIQLLLVYILFFIHKFFTFSKAEHNPKMATTRVLILSHSFVHRLHTFLLAHYGRDFVNNFNLSDDLIFKWLRRGGRTVAKIRQYDLGVVESFAP